MSLIGRLFGQMRPVAASKRHLMPAEVRELIEQRRLDEAEAAIERLYINIKDRESYALSLRGEIAFHRHEDTLAEACFRSALAQNAGLPDAHYGLSVLMHARGDKEAALRHVVFAINRDGTQARYHAQAGLCQIDLLNYSRAERFLMLATRLAPSDRYSWNNLGIAQRARGNLKGASESFTLAVAIDPSFESAQANLQQLKVDAAAAGAELRPKPARPGGDLLADKDLQRMHELEVSGDAHTAISLCETLLVSRPDDANIPVQLSRLYRKHGDPQSGIDVLRGFLATHPEEEATTVALAKLLAGEHDNNAAEPYLEAALKLRPDDAELWHELADIRAEKDRIAEAGEMYERAYELKPTFENKARLVASLIGRCRYEDGLRLCDELLRERPEVEEDLIGFRVYALTSLGQHDEALPILDRAVAQRPYDPMRRYPRAVIHLLNERYDIGWDDYSYRNLATSRDFRMLPFPEWQGEPLEGKKIIVLAEQGLGDQVMFASCLPDLFALQPSKVWVEVIDRIAPTLARSFPECEVISTKQDKRLDWVKSLGDVDYFVAIADLPRRFRRSVQAFPAHDGYLRADAARVAHWRATLASLGARPKIGVSWRGGMESTRRVLRSTELTALKPLWEAVGADWVCLQYGNVQGDLEAARDAGMPIHHWPEPIKNLDEFAALISGLDLIITVCNTTVHYAGALARPTWILAPKVPEWRYGLRTATLPWYPSTTMYRQAELGEWGELIHRVSQELSSWTPGAKNVTPARG